MDRRQFLLVTAALASGLRPAAAQQPTAKKRLAVIGFTKVETLRIGGDPYAHVFFEELKRLGYVEGENLIVDRWQFQPGRVADIAREVVEANPDVIASWGSPMTSRLKAATTTIPIVAFTGDPVRFGIVTNLARPGGNITGVSADAGVEIWAKRLQLLSDAVPGLTKVLFVSTEGGWAGAGGQTVREAAQKLGITLVRATVSSPYGDAEYRQAFSSIQPGQLDGMMLSDENDHYGKQSVLLQLVQQARLPAIFGQRFFVEAGGLMAYVYDLKSLLRRQATQIVDVFRGVKPSDIPFYQAERFELVINLKTAKELGLDIPAGLVAGAAAVIE